MTNKSNKDNFIKKATLIHGDKYNYDNVIYISNRKPVEIKCQTHGIFLQRPDNHLAGKGCIQCAGKAKMTIEQFIEKAKKIHGIKYNYDLVDLQSTHQKVNIICNVHGMFEQEPNHHLIQMNGCPRCVGMNTDTKFFIEKAKLVHGEKYNYDLVDYKNPTTKLTIMCSLHGIFEQTPNHHLGNTGCPKCNINISKKEIAWLDSLEESDRLIRPYTVRVSGKRSFFADAYDPQTNTIYEFYGDFWHGNPEVYGPPEINKVSNILFSDLYSKTLEKETVLKKLGYHIISIWEKEWDAKLLKDNK